MTSNKRPNDSSPRNACWAKTTSSLSAGEHDGQPLVSVVTPVYNQREYLESTMLSVLSQTYPNVEYIIIDDGSDDDSLAIAQRVASGFPSRKVTVLTQQNCGQAATLNKGWGIAKGEMLAYLSSDDRLLPQAVERIVESLRFNADANVAYCDFWLIDSVGKRVKEFRTEEFNSRRLLVDLVCQPGPGAVFRRSVFDQTGGWVPRLRQVPDFDFWLRAEQYGRFVRVAETLAEYRIHEKSASFQIMSDARAEEIVAVIQEYWGSKTEGSPGNQSLARAHVLAAKNHAQSGRLSASFTHVYRAIKLRPALCLRPSTWRDLISGLVRRYWYILVTKTAAH